MPSPDAIDKTSYYSTPVAGQQTQPLISSLFNAICGRHLPPSTFFITSASLFYHERKQFSS